MEVIINSIHIKFTDIVDVKQPIKLNSLAVNVVMCDMTYVCYFIVYSAFVFVGFSLPGHPPTQNKNKNKKNKAKNFKVGITTTQNLTYSQSGPFLIPDLSLGF